MVRQLTRHALLLGRRRDGEVCAAHRPAARRRPPPSRDRQRGGRGPPTKTAVATYRVTSEGRATTPSYQATAAAHLPIATQCTLQRASWPTLAPMPPPPPTDARQDRPLAIPIPTTTAIRDGRRAAGWLPFPSPPPPQVKQLPQDHAAASPPPPTPPLPSRQWHARQRVSPRAACTAARARAGQRNFRWDGGEPVGARTVRTGTVTAECEGEGAAATSTPPRPQTMMRAHRPTVPTNEIARWWPSALLFVRKREGRTGRRAPTWPRRTTPAWHKPQQTGGGGEVPHGRPLACGGCTTWTCAKPPALANDLGHVGEAQPGRI